MNRDQAEALWALSDRLWWLECQEWMVQEWLVEIRPDDFPGDRRYIASKARLDGLRFAAREALNMALSTKKAGPVR